MLLYTPYVAEAGTSCAEPSAVKLSRARFQYDTVVDDCTAAVELDPSYVKALLRRAQASERLEKYDLALEGDVPFRIPGRAQVLRVSSGASFLSPDATFSCPGGAEFRLQRRYFGHAACSESRFRSSTAVVARRGRRRVSCFGQGSSHLHTVRGLYPLLLSTFAAFRRRADAKALLEIDPSLRSAKESVGRLEKLQNEKNERMKEEAIGEFSRGMVPPERSLLCRRTLAALMMGAAIDGARLFVYELHVVPKSCYSFTSIRTCHILCCSVGSKTRTGKLAGSRPYTAATSMIPTNVRLCRLRRESSCCRSTFGCLFSAVRQSRLVAQIAIAVAVVCPFFGLVNVRAELPFSSHVSAAVRTRC